ncbi:hypothetical protein [Desulfuromonas sp. TF]|uniref:hypothetical protein n=1 Tax=Desulfuromonas sp. TF TaxID=1232410 RepID=UPI0003FBCAEB|nr:hypothetical protein [Desulfuromonas sp. TF]
MIYLAAPVFDLQGMVTLSRTSLSDYGALTRRGSRSATLDGAAVLLDSGYSEADRTFRIVAKGQSREIYEAAAYLLRTYSQLLLSCPEGLFVGGLRDLRPQGADIVFTFLVLEKLA